MQIEDRERTRGSSQPIIESSGASRSQSQALMQGSGSRSSSQALDRGNYGRDGYLRQSPDPSPERGSTARPSRCGGSSRGGSRYEDENQSSLRPRTSGPRQSESRMTYGGRSMANTARLGGIEEEDKYYDRSAMVRSGGRSQALTPYGGASMAVRRGKADHGDDDTDSEQEVIAKKRFSNLSGQHFTSKFPALGDLLEEVLQIKPAKLDEFCDDHYIRLDLTKNCVDVSKLLKHVGPNSREKCEKAIKKYNTHQENERHLYGGKLARSIFDPIDDDRETGRGGASAGEGKSTRDGDREFQGNSRRNYGAVVHHTTIVEAPVPVVRMHRNPWRGLDSIDPQMCKERNLKCPHCDSYCGRCDLTYRNSSVCYWARISGLTFPGSW